MKKSINILIVTILLPLGALAQSILLTPDKASEQAKIEGGVSIRPKVTAPVSSPTVLSYTIPFSDFRTFSIDGNESVYLYDPGGESGNYGPNARGTVRINGGGDENTLHVFRLTVEYFETENADDVLSISSNGGTHKQLSGNVSTQTFDLYVLGVMSIHFRSDSDSNVGRGFKLLIKKVYYSFPIADFSYQGPQFTFNPYFSILKIGYFSGTETSGLFSTSIGFNVEASGQKAIVLGTAASASGEYSLALGSGASATGAYSRAIGNSTSSGENSTAIGNSRAYGNYATAIGQSEASGDYAIAIGQSWASGNHSVAIGSSISTDSKRGAFIIGDSNPIVFEVSDYLRADVEDKFFARFYNGYWLKTGKYAGVHMIHNDNSWRSISDSTKKENFAPIDFESFLVKASKLRAATWNYKGQDPKQYRHYGPMAQEFYAAFGKDKYGTIGNDTTLSSADIDGVNFVLIQALERRTKALQEENDCLKKQVESLMKMTKRIEKLEAMLNKEQDSAQTEN